MAKNYVYEYEKFENAPKVQKIRKQKKKTYDQVVANKNRRK